MEEFRETGLPETPGAEAKQASTAERVPSLGAALLTLAGTLLVLVLAAWLSLRGLIPLSGLSKGRFAWAAALEVTSLGLPLLVLFGLGKYDLPASLGLQAPSAASLAGAVLIGAGLVSLAPQIEAWQARLFPPPVGYLEGLSEMLSAPDNASFILALAGLALAPAFLEELLFRGLLQGAARRHFGSGAVIILSGILFGLFHLDLYRWFILALIGLLLAWVAETAGSLWPAVAAHLINNTLALVLVNFSTGAEQSWVDSVGDVPAPWLAAGAACLLAGVFLVRRSGRAAPAPD